MPTSLVTGGAGFLGSHVAERLLDRGHDVVILDNLSGGFVENLPHDATFVQGSILDTRLIETLFDQYRIDYVFHLAAYAAEGLSHFIKRFNYENNVIGTVNLINASVNHTSSTSCLPRRSRYTARDRCLSMRTRHLRPKTLMESRNGRVSRSCK